MGVLAVDWQPFGVSAACNVGPEQSPVVVEQALVSGDLLVDSNGKPFLAARIPEISADSLVGRLVPLESPASIPAFPDPAMENLSRIRAVIDLLDGGDLGDGRTSCGPDARLKGRAGKTLLEVGGKHWGPGDVLDSFACLLIQRLESIINAQPRLVALIGPKPRKLALIIPNRFGPVPRRRLHQLFRAAGADEVDSLTRIEAITCFLQAEVPSNRSYVVLDWDIGGLTIAHVEPAPGGELVSAQPIERIAGVGRSALRKAIASRLALDGDQSDGTERPAADTRADAWVLENFCNFECFEETVDPVVEEWLRVPFRRMRNRLGSLNSELEGGSSAVVPTGPGFGLAHANALLHEVFRNCEVVETRDRYFAAVQGAARLAAQREPPCLPYDCGLLLRFERRRTDHVGLLIASKGASLPFLGNTRVVEIAGRPLEPVSIAVYLRKVDLGKGSLAFYTHGWYAYMPARDSSSRARLSATVTIAEDGRIDVRLRDHIAGEELRLEEMGMLGGEPINFLPPRALEEGNGRILRSLWSDFVASTLAANSDPTVEAWREFLADVSMEQGRSLRATAHSILEADWSLVLGDQKVAECLSELGTIVEEEERSERELGERCLTVIDLVLRELNDLLETQAEAFGIRSEIPPARTMEAVGDSSPLSEPAHRQMFAALTRLLNLVETRARPDEKTQATLQQVRRIQEQAGLFRSWLAEGLRQVHQ